MTKNDLSFETRVTDYQAGGALVFDDDPTDNTDWLNPLRSLK